MKILSVFVFSILQAAPAIAIDLQPGELVPPKSGANILLLQYQQSERSDRYASGVKQAGNSKISASQFQARVGRAFELLGQPVFFYGQTGTADIKPGGSLGSLQGDSGMTDTALALAVWPYANRETGNYVGTALYLVSPTGSYSRDRSFNIGENRYRTAVQAGFQYSLIKQLNWMAAIDGLWYGENTDFRPTRITLSQQALYTGQTSLQYEFNPSYSIASSYFYSVGGETSWNGVSRNDVTRLQRYMLSGTATYPFGRVSLQYGGDLKTENGYWEDQRITLRYAMRF